MRIDGHVSAYAERTVGRLAFGLRDSGDTGSTVIKAVATVEAHVDSTIARLVQEAPESNEPFGRFLIAKAAAGLKRSWESRHEALRDGFGIVVEPQRLTQNLMLVVDIRNALAHGDGAFTSWQRSNWSRAIELRRSLERKLEVTTVGRAISISRRSVEIATAMLVDYVLALDAAVENSRR